MPLKRRTPIPESYKNVAKKNQLRDIIKYQNVQVVPISPTRTRGQLQINESEEQTTRLEKQQNPRELSEENPTITTGVGVGVRARVW